MIRAIVAKTALAGFLLIPSAMGDAAPPPTVRTTPPKVNFFDAGKAHCWARTYDDKHLATHPKQKVTAIAFAYRPETPIDGGSEPNWDRYSETPSFSGVVVVTIKGDRRKAAVAVGCQAASDKTRLDCTDVNDGGGFVLADAGGSELRLENTKGFTATVLDANGNIAPVQIDPKDDQADFVLTAGNDDLCKAAYAP